MWANLGARLTGREQGVVVIEAQLTAEAHGLRTARGDIVHGGAIAALADMALALAGMSVAGDGNVVTTVQEDGTVVAEVRALLAYVARKP